MIKDTMQRAIDRGAGNTEAENIEELTYEGYGVSGVAVMVDCMTITAIERLRSTPCVFKVWRQPRHRWQRYVPV